MKKSLISIEFAVILAVFLVSTMACAQTDKSKRPSPPETAKGMIAGANITIDYSSPGVVSPKGDDRTGKIWGELEPYDKYWRAGANEATIVTTDKDIMVEGKKLPKGSYSFFVMPKKDGNWSVLFNSETGQWGIKQGGNANFDPAKNVLEVSVKTEKSANLEKRLKYEIDSKGFTLSWEYVKVPLKVTKTM
jgi:hypothetical protein